MYVCMCLRVSVCICGCVRVLLFSTNYADTFIVGLYVLCTCACVCVCLCVFVCVCVCVHLLFSLFSCDNAARLNFGIYIHASVCVCVYVCVRI